MLAGMVSISWPRDPPALASQSAGITDVSHHARSILVFVLEIFKKNIREIIWKNNSEIIKN